MPAGGVDAHDASLPDCPPARPQQLQQQRPLRVEPVLRLVHHDRVGPVQHRVVDLHVAAHRQAVHHDAPAAPGRAQPAGREPPVAQRGALGGLLLRLAVELHRAPRLHIHRVGADRRVVGIIDDVDELAARLLGDAADQRGVLRVELVAGRPGDHDLHAEPGRGERRAGGHRGRERLGMPGPGEDEALAGGLAQLLAQRHGVGQRLAGMPPGGLEVDHRLLAVAGEAPEDQRPAGPRPSPSPGESSARRARRRSGRAPAPHPRCARRVSPSITAPGSVSSDQLPLPRLQHHRVAAVEEHRRLEAGAGAQARVHEDHRQHLALQSAADLAPLDPAPRGRAARSTSSGDQSSSARKSRLVTRAPPRVPPAADRPRGRRRRAAAAAGARRGRTRCR